MLAELRAPRALARDVGEIPSSSVPADQRARLGRARKAAATADQQARALLALLHDELLLAALRMAKDEVETGTRTPYGTKSERDGRVARPSEPRDHLVTARQILDERRGATGG